MNQMDWDDVRFFLAAAHTGSLAAAARQIGTHQPTVGRRIDGLEHHLGVRLFQRHALGLTLTDEGRRILAAAESMAEAAAAVRRASHREDTEIRGSLRISAPNGLAVHVLAPALPQFHERFPHLDVTLLPSAASADLARGEADVAVRLYRPTAGELVIRRAGHMGLGLYASRSYLERQGAPESTADLLGHALIGPGSELCHLEESRWLESVAKGARYLLRCDDMPSRLAAVEAGLGIAVLPHVLAQRSGRLQPILGSENVPSKTVWLVVHRDLRELARVRAAFAWLDNVLVACGVT